MGKPASVRGLEGGSSPTPSARTAWQERGGAPANDGGRSGGGGDGAGAGAAGDADGCGDVAGSGGGGRSPWVRASTRWLLAASLVLLAAVLATAYAAQLPDPLGEDAAVEEFAEARAMRHVERIARMGPHPLGSPALDVVFEYVLSQVRLAQSSQGPGVAVDVDIQRVDRGANTHSFPGRTLLYQRLRNIVVRVRGEAWEGGAAGGNLSWHSILVSSHIDSVVTSPGAGDCASCIAIMLETLRALSLGPAPPDRHAVVFLFNDAEEEGLDGSHAFLSQHPWAGNVRAAIDLEAMGSGGRHVVFQAGPSAWLLNLYHRTARAPTMSISAQDLFLSGLLKSATDFQVYRDMGGLSGLDFAFMENGAIYHTRNDDVPAIRRGSLQLAGDNLLPLLQTAVADPRLAVQKRRNGAGDPRLHPGLAAQARRPSGAGIVSGEGQRGRIVEGRTEPHRTMPRFESVYFDVLGITSAVYPFTTASVVASSALTLFTAAFFLALCRLPFPRSLSQTHSSLSTSASSITKQPKEEQTKGADWRCGSTSPHHSVYRTAALTAGIAVALAGHVATWIAALVGAANVALVVSFYTPSPTPWFAHHALAYWLYCPAAAAAAVAASGGAAWVTRGVVGMLCGGTEAELRDVAERLQFWAVGLLWAALAVMGSYGRIGATYHALVWALGPAAAYTLLEVAPCGRVAGRGLLWMTAVVPTVFAIAISSPDWFHLVEVGLGNAGRFSRTPGIPPHWALEIAASFLLALFTVSGITYLLPLAHRGGKRTTLAVSLVLASVSAAAVLAISCSLVPAFTSSAARIINTVHVFEADGSRSFISVSTTHPGPLDEVVRPLGAGWECRDRDPPVILGGYELGHDCQEDYGPTPPPLLRASVPTLHAASAVGAPIVTGGRSAGKSSGSGDEWCRGQSDGEEECRGRSDGNERSCGEQSDGDHKVCGWDSQGTSQQLPPETRADRPGDWEGAFQGNGGINLAEEGAFEGGRGMLKDELKRRVGLRAAVFAVRTGGGIRWSMAVNASVVHSFRIDTIAHEDAAVVGFDPSLAKPLVGWHVASVAHRSLETHVVQYAAGARASDGAPPPDFLLHLRLHNHTTGAEVAAHVRVDWPLVSSELAEVRSRLPPWTAEFGKSTAPFGITFIMTLRT